MKLLLTVLALIVIVKEASAQKHYNGQQISQEINIALQNSKIDKAIELLNIGIVNEPENKGFHFALGTCFDSKHQYNKAIECYKRAIQIDYDYFEANYNCGVNYIKLGNAHLDQANAIPPHLDKDGNKFAKKKQEANEYFRQSIKYLEIALDFDPHDKALSTAISEIKNKLEKQEKETISPDTEEVSQSISTNDPINVSEPFWWESEELVLRINQHYQFAANPMPIEKAYEHAYYTKNPPEGEADVKVRKLVNKHKEISKKIRSANEFQIDALQKEADDVKKKIYTAIKEHPIFSSDHVAIVRDVLKDMSTYQYSSYFDKYSFDKQEFPIYNFPEKIELYHKYNESGIGFTHRISHHYIYLKFLNIHKFNNLKYKIPKNNAEKLIEKDRHIIYKIKYQIAYPSKKVNETMHTNSSDNIISGTYTESKDYIFANILQLEVWKGDKLLFSINESNSFQYQNK